MNKRSLLHTLFFIRLRAENFDCKARDEGWQSALWRISLKSIEGGSSEAPKERRRVNRGSASLKAWSFVILTLCFLSGCLHSEEHLSVDKDGSGTLEVDLMMPESTICLIDSTMGAMMQGMMKAFGSKEKPPESVVEKMFGDKEEIFKKAEKAGLNIEFLSFESEKKDNDLYVHYKYKFDDINKLLLSGLLSTKFDLYKDSQGDIVCFLKQDPQKAQEHKERIQRMKEGHDGQSMMSKVMEQKMLEAMKDFKIEFAISLPTHIKRAQGCFKKSDEKTAVLSFQGDILANPALIDELYGMTDTPNEVVWDAKGMDFALAGEKRQKAEKEFTSSPEEFSSKKHGSLRVGSRVKILLKSNDSVEGEVVEEAEDYVKVDTVGIPLTYFKDDIERIEQIT